MSDRPTAEELVGNAEGNVTEGLLTETRGLLNTYLQTKPSIEYLRDDEQPHYIYWRVDGRDDRGGKQLSEHHAGTMTSDGPR